MLNTRLYYTYNVETQIFKNNSKIDFGQQQQQQQKVNCKWHNKRGNNINNGNGKNIYNSN